jgi:hypothetical protein
LLRDKYGCRLPQHHRHHFLAGTPAMLLQKLLKLAILAGEDYQHTAAGQHPLKLRQECRIEALVGLGRPDLLAEGEVGDDAGNAGGLQG